MVYIDQGKHQYTEYSHNQKALVWGLHSVGWGSCPTTLFCHWGPPPYPFWSTCTRSTRQIAPPAPLVGLPRALGTL